MAFLRVSGQVKIRLIWKKIYSTWELSRKSGMTIQHVGILITLSLRRTRASSNTTYTESKYIRIGGGFVLGGVVNPLEGFFLDVLQPTR